MKIQDTSITVNAGCNEHTRAAVEAIAAAAEANAQALIAAAKALTLQGPSYGIYVAAPVKEAGDE